MADFYLTSSDEPTQTVRCPVHGFITFSRNEREVIDHWVFQRLRHIRQLAMTYLVYPGAMHSRFEHSLGVMELATRAFHQVARKEEAHVVKELQSIPEFGGNTLAKARQALRIAALLHDVGHAPFSHAAEKVIPTGDHEQISMFVIKDVLGTKLDTLFYEGISDVILRLLAKSEELAFLQQFVTGEIDMDRTDYLLRDSLHCGVSYGVFDYRRFIETLTIITNPDTGRLQLAIERGGEHSIEALILARYHMHTQVYLHKIRRIYDYYLIRYMELWGAEHCKTVADVLQHNDGSVTAEIYKDANAENARTPWAHRIAFRKHHRVVYTTGDNADISRLKKTKRLLRHLEEDFPTVDFYLDNAEFSISKLAVPGDQEERVEDLYIRERDDRKTLLAHESAIIGKVPKRVRTVRIFADVHDDTLKKIYAAVNAVEATL